MTTNKIVLLLYPENIDPTSGAALKNDLLGHGVEVEELIMVDNYSQVLDWLEEPVIPVVMGE